MTQRDELVEHKRVLKNARTLLADTTRNSSELAAVVAEAKASLAASRALLRRPVTTLLTPQNGRTFPAIDELVARIERTVAHANPLDDLTALIKSLVPGDTDPGVLMGVLLEGIVQVLLQRIPAAERRDTVIALCTMLCQRLNLLDIGLS